MADLAVTAALALAKDVFNFLNQNWNFIENLHDEVVHIRTWLSTIKAYLKDMEDKDGDERFKDKVKLIQEIAYDIEDILDEFMLHVAPGQIRRRKHFRKFRQQLNTLRNRSTLHKVSSDIQKIKKKIDGIKDSYAVTSNLERGSSSGSPIEQQMMHVLDDDEIIGFAKPGEELIQKLMDEESTCMTISLVGPGGSGKSILAKNVYERKRIKGKFDCHAWVHVSQSFNHKVREGLWYSLLKLFCESREETIPNEGVDTQERLRYYLQGKRYLVVLDDIWKQEHWEWIKSALPSSSFRSRIIVTTQNSDLTFSWPHYMVSLPGLQWHEAWDLFCKKAFRNRDGECPKELMDCSERIVKRCEGLPLAIVAVGGLLSTKPQFPNEWEKVHNSLLSDVSTISSRVLLPSYRDLSSHLRNCFLYLSIFPEDSSIERGRLIRLWIAERFVMEESRKTLEQVAENYLNELIGRNLIHVSSWDFDGRVKTCRVPNLVLDFIVDKSKEENFTAVLTEPIRSPSDKVRRLSALNVCTDLSPFIQITSIRSIFLSRWEKSACREVAKAICKFKFLRVLDLQGAPLDKFPEDISHLTLLRYLSLRDTRIKVVPGSIEKLLYLETLDLKQTDVSELPKQISNLHNLRHLLVYCYRVMPYVTFDSVQGAKLLDGIEGLTNLQKLSMVNPEKHRGIIKDFRALTQLKKLGLIHLRREDGKEFNDFGRLF